MEGKKTFWQRNGWEILTIVSIILMFIALHNSKEDERVKIIERMKEKDKAKLVSLLEEIEEEREIEGSNNFELFKNPKEDKTIVVSLDLKVDSVRLADKTILNYLENVEGRLLIANKPMFGTFGKRDLSYLIEVPKETEGLETLERDLQIFLKREETKTFKKEY